MFTFNYYLVIHDEGKDVNCIFLLITFRVHVSICSYKITNIFVSFISLEAWQEMRAGPIQVVLDAKEPKQKAQECFPYQDCHD